MKIFCCYSRVMKRYVALMIGLLIMGSSTQAQFFNLELEDAPPATPPVRLPASLKPVDIMAAKLPSAENTDGVVFDKLYEEILGDLKENKMEEAKTIFSKVDIITKQKLIYKMIRENPINEAGGKISDPVDSSN